MCMYIANATLKSVYGTTRVRICTEPCEESLENKDDCTICCREPRRPLVDEILKAAAKGVLPIKFSLNDDEYELIKYSKNEMERQYNVYAKNHVVREEKISTRSIEHFYVYADRRRCTSCYSKYGFDSIINICAIVALYDIRSKSVRIDASQCTHCGKFFIDAESLDAYERRYGLLYIYKRHITGNEEEHWNESKYSQDSILSRNGYSTKLDKVERHRILRDMIGNGINKSEIIDTLTRFSKRKGDQFEEARWIWKADLEYISDFNLDKQEIVKFV